MKVQNVYPTTPKRVLSKEKALKHNPHTSNQAVLKMIGIKLLLTAK